MGVEGQEWRLLYDVRIFIISEWKDENWGFYGVKLREGTLLERMIDHPLLGVDLQITGRKGCQCSGASFPLWRLTRKGLLVSPELARKLWLSFIDDNIHRLL